jgi:transposase, IS5 family
MMQAELRLNRSAKRTRKREFLAQMERVVPWSALVELVTPFASEGKKGRPPFAVQTMLRIHFMQQWFTLSDPAMEEALHDMPLFREFARLDYSIRLPDERTILRFRHLLEQHQLADQMLATINELLSSKGLLLQGPARWSTPRLWPRPARRITRTANATPRCIRPRRATSGTSA